MKLKDFKNLPSELDEYDVCFEADDSEYGIEYYQLENYQVKSLSDYTMVKGKMTYLESPALFIIFGN